MRKWEMRNLLNIFVNNEDIRFLGGEAPASWW